MTAPTVLNAATYATAKARYKRAVTVLDAALQRVEATGNHPDIELLLTPESAAAAKLLTATIRALNADLDAVVKKFRIGPYIPYGRRFTRRY